MDKGEWISAIAVIISLAVLIRGYLINPTFIPAAHAQELRSTISELREEISALRLENSELKKRINDLMAECEFWRNQYRNLMPNLIRSPDKPMRE